MKKIIALSLSALTLNSFAAGTLSCLAEDGSKLTAIVNGDQGSVPHQFKLQVREGALKDYPDARAKYYESDKKFYNGKAQDEKINLLVVEDPTDGIIAIIKDGTTLIDSSGVYSADCEFGY